MSAAILNRLKPAVSSAIRLWNCKAPVIDHRGPASVRLYSGLMEPGAPLFRQVMLLCSDALQISLICLFMWREEKQVYVVVFNGALLTVCEYGTAKMTRERWFLLDIISSYNQWPEWFTEVWWRPSEMQTQKGLLKSAGAYLASSKKFSKTINADILIYSMYSKHGLCELEQNCHASTKINVENIFMTSYCMNMFSMKTKDWNDCEAQLDSYNRKCTQIATFYHSPQFRKRKSFIANLSRSAQTEWQDR